jgi:hypothetical protein
VTIFIIYMKSARTKYNSEKAALFGRAQELKVKGKEGQDIEDRAYLRRLDADDSYLHFINSLRKQSRDLFTNNDIERVVNSLEGTLT